MSLKTAIEKAGITQTELSIRTNSNKALISRHVSQDCRYANTTTLYKLAKALDCNVLEIMPDFCENCGHVIDLCKCKQWNK